MGNRREGKRVEPSLLSRTFSTWSRRGLCDVFSVFIYKPPITVHLFIYKINHCSRTPSQSLQVYQSFHLGSTRDCELISPALVQIKVTTGATDRQKQDDSQNGDGFACGDHRQMLSLLHWCHWLALCSPDLNSIEHLWDIM